MNTVTKEKVVGTIKLDDRTDVYLTDKALSVRSGSRKAGDKVSLHPKQAEQWIKAGKATTEPQKPAGQKGGEKA